MNLSIGINLALPLALLAFCLFENVLHRHSVFFQEWVTAFLALQWMAVICLALWCVGFLWRLFRSSDLWLIALLLIGITFFFIGESRSSADALVLLFGVALGKGTQFLLKSGTRNAERGNYLTGLVALFVFASWWHLEEIGAYRGPRWMGLWDNPNTYGMLMGTGGVLAIGLLAAILKSETGNLKSENFGGKKPVGDMRNFPNRIFLLIVILMLGVGLVMSYSRGAWLGAAVGLLYLTWCYGKLKWRYVLPVAAIVAAVLLYHWGSTPESAPWYVKRADLGRPSAQNRVIAWRAGLQMMRDHPFGVGWNNAVEIYQKGYHPPEAGGAALNTNDYIMMGTELGITALVCFVSYVALCLRGKCKVENEAGRIQAACRAGALVLVVAFWFDGGLFKLATASVFWILLELGAARGGKVDSGELIVERKSSESPA